MEVNITDERPELDLIITEDNQEFDVQITDDGQDVTVNIDDESNEVLIEISDEEPPTKITIEESHGLSAYQLYLATTTANPPLSLKDWLDSFGGGSATQYIDAQIRDVKLQIISLDAYLEGAFSDGIISAAEAVAIEKYLNQINTEKADVQATYSNLYNNATLTGAPKTNLGEAWVAYDSAHQNLVNSINAAIADGKTTVAEKADVDAKFVLYRNTLATLSTRLQEAISAADQPDLSSFEATRDYVNSALQTDLADLKNRADGVIESWFYSHTPNLSNLPASNWTTNEQKDSHIGDTFTNMQEFVDNTTTPDAGKAWRFARNADNTYSWNLIANSDSTKALIEAGKAKDTADSKRRVFIAQPFPPYDLGDLWSQGTTGDLMRCKFARTSGVYVATDWEKASKYTDDTRAIQAETAAKEYTDDIKSQIDGELSDLATEITNLSDAVTDLPIGALTDTVLFGIKQQKNSVQSEYQDVYSRYLIIRDDAALLNKLPVTNAFANYYNAYNSLISYFDSAFNDSAITQAEKDELTARFTAYKNQVSLFSTALQNAVQAIQEQKIDNIQIGGRNLILHSKNYNTDTSIWFTPNGSFIQASDIGMIVGESVLITPNFTEQFINGEVYTISFKLITSTPVIVNFNSSNKTFNNGNGERASFTFRADTSNNLTTIYFYNPTQGSSCNISNIKLEKGNKATDWSPAPEDIAADIETAKTSATQAAKAYSDAQDIVKETTTRAYADGIVTAAEQRSINDATAKANAAKSYADAQDVNLKILIDAQTDGKISTLETELINSSNTNLAAAKLYADAQSEAAREAAKAWADGEITAEEAARIAQADANLTNAKNYAEAQDALLKLQQEAYADNKVSVSEAAAIAEAKAYADLKKAEAEVYADGIVDAEEQARLNQALLNLNEAKAHANAVVDNIQIGGRNLLRNSKKLLDQNNDWVSNFNLSQPLEIGKEYTITIKSGVQFEDDSFHINDINSNNYVNLIKKSIDEFVATFIATRSSSEIVVVRTPLGSEHWYQFFYIKLEKGNKATDWTPAPEDVDAEFVLVKAEINDVDNKLTNLQTNFTDFASDGVINIAEAKALKNIAQTLNNEKADVNQKYLQAYNDANLIDKTPLQTAWDIYNTNHTDLLSYINTYTSGDRAISPAELATVNNAFTNYRTALSALSAALEMALKVIADLKINVVQVDATAAKAQAQNAQNTAAATAAVTSFLQTDISTGNVVSTGTLQVGSATGANAGITGVVDRAGASVRFWAGSNYVGKNTADWLIRDDGVEEQWFNGILVRQRGVIDGAYIETWYNLNGQIGKKITFNPDGKILEEWYNNGSLVYQIGQNGIYYVAEIAESYSLRRFRNLNTNVSTSDLQSFEADLRTYMWQKTVNPTQFELRGDKDAYLYMAGQNVYSEGNKQYEGYKNTQSKIDNITDGWYAEEKLGNMMADATFETKRIANVVKIQAGKIVQSGFVTIETQGYTFNQF